MKRTAFAVVLVVALLASGRSTAEDNQDGGACQAQPECTCSSAYTYAGGEECVEGGEDCYVKTCP